MQNIHGESKPRVLALIPQSPRESVSHQLTFTDAVLQSHKITQKGLLCANILGLLAAHINTS